MAFQLSGKNDHPSSSTAAVPSAEQMQKESKKKLMHNIFYFGFIIAGLRFASSMLNDGSAIMMITLNTGLILFWNILSIGIIISGTITLNGLQSKRIPEFIRSLVLYGKFKSLKQQQSNDNDSMIKRWPTYYRLLSILDAIIRMLEVPKYWFRHFYIISFLINSALIIRMFCCSIQFETIILIGLQWLQSLRRLYETFYVSIYSGNTINLVHYIVGIFFYITIGLATFNDCHLVQSSNSSSSSSMIAVFIFFTSSAIQYQSHRILAKLRSSKAKQNNDYYIPRGGLFEYISCPHYMTEILIYICLWLQSSRSYLWSTMVMFVIANQTIASLMSYRWYRKRFNDRYPTTIKALIPFLF
ncbi:Steroid 5 alpha-reductase 3 [Dermatophagoides farinae]|uniref:Polyprenal reductase n=1 Tax=Dermatophagoides farinae TaxID=6954 RepID=A0A922I6A2_DERFA|nr:Steroid 5 alpha-reductase 3 [Dermatophagoides farinae]